MGKKSAKKTGAKKTAGIAKTTTRRSSEKRELLGAPGRDLYTKRDETVRSKRDGRCRTITEG